MVFIEVLSAFHYYELKLKPKVRTIQTWQNKNEGLIKQKEVH